MLILRLGRGVIDHFPVRRSEWINSLVMVGWGLLLWLDGLPLYGAWTYLTVSLDETAWSFLLMTIGGLRLIVLGINGTFPQSWYGPWAPHVRVAMSLICALAWLQLVLAGIKAPVWSTGVAAYAGYLVSDTLNTWSAAAEARELDKGRRNVAERLIETGQPTLHGSSLRRTGGWFRNRLRPKEPTDPNAN